MSGGENPSQVPTPSGGRGNCVLADLYDPHRARGAAGILATAIKYGYVDAFCIDYSKARAAAEELADKDDPRLKAAGAKLLVSMAAHDLNVVTALDKGERLDSGDVTDRTAHEHTHTVYTCEPPRVIGEAT
jgi:hypothetical protein